HGRVGWACFGLTRCTTTQASSSVSGGSCTGSASGLPPSFLVRRPYVSSSRSVEARSIRECETLGGSLPASCSFLLGCSSWPAARFGTSSRGNSQRRRLTVDAAPPRRRWRSRRRPCPIGPPGASSGLTAPYDRAYFPADRR